MLKTQSKRSKTKPRSSHDGSDTNCLTEWQIVFSSKGDRTYFISEDTNIKKNILFGRWPRNIINEYWQASKVCNYLTVLLFVALKQTLDTQLKYINNCNSFDLAPRV